MQTLDCGICAPARHLRWSDAVLSRLSDARCQALRLHKLPGDAASLTAALNAGEPACTRVLMFATPDTVDWAARLLGALRPHRLPALLITRGLSAAPIERLLDAGASDFLSHLFDIEELLARMDRLLGAPPPAPPAAVTGTAAPAASDCVMTQRQRALAPLVGRSPAFVAQVERIPALAACHAAVLVIGDTGTGKELAARAIHYLSPRADGPWIAINCAALPPELVESELFGHLRGAYTSADRNREGLVAQAEHGTLFLDEVDSLPLPVQAKLLRFLQDKEYRPVGAGPLCRADVRIVAATNTDLAARIAGGSFRRDLYYRLNVLTLKLPALRERREDIALLAGHFAAHYAREFGRAAPQIAPAALRCLEGHDWPGNVRELEHCIERAVLLGGDDRIEPAQLELPAAAAVADGRDDDAPPDAFPLAKARVVEAFERQYIEQLLRRCGGNISRAAAAASKNRRVFWELMRKHHIDARAYRLG